MSCYIDTSALVSVLTNERATQQMNTWLRAQLPTTVFISDWTHTEVASALSIKLRTGNITLAMRADAVASFTELAASSLPTLAVIRRHFAQAAAFAGRHELGLRAGDALHFAIALDNGLSLVTLDRTMADAALQIGIPVEAI